jgi:hypothetical protein
LSEGAQVTPVSLRAIGRRRPSAQGPGP